MDKAYLEELVGAEAAEEILRRHEGELAALRTQHAVSMAVRSAGGRNETAIRALLDESAIANAENMEQAACSAVASLKKAHGYLFEAPRVSSPGTGALTVNGEASMEEIGKMSMAEYRRYRLGR